MPTTSGSKAARPRKKISDRRMSSGNANISARPRSSSTVSPICAPETAPPPTVTPCSPSNAASAVLADLLVVGARVDDSRHEPAVAVTGEAGGRGLRDARHVGQLIGHGLRALLERCTGAAGDEQDDARRRFAAGGGLELVARAGGFRAVGGEATAGVELPRERATDQTGQGDEQEDDDEGAPRTCRGETSESVEHGPIVVARGRAHIGSGEALRASRLLRRE